MRALLRGLSIGWVIGWPLGFILSSCSIPLKIDAGNQLCVAEWSKDFAEKAGKEAEALPEGSALREVIAQYVDIRRKAQRC